MKHLKSEHASKVQRHRVELLELTDAQALEAAKSDPDCPPLTLEQLRKMKRVVPRGNGFYGPPRRKP